MSRKHFSVKVKLHWVKKYIESNDKLSVVYEFYKFYKWRYYKQTPGGARRSISGRLQVWVSKYNTLGERGLIDMAGKGNKGKVRKRKISINDLSEHDRGLYQTVLENILNDKGISNEDIMNEIKKIKDKKEKNKSAISRIWEPENIVLFTGALGISKSSWYYFMNLKPRVISEKSIEDFNPLLVEKIVNKSIDSDKTKGRDKVYKELISEGIDVTSYEVRLIWKLKELGSLAYKKANRPPKEEKLKKQREPDLIKGNFAQRTPYSVWFSDISYIKIKGKWWHLLIYIDGYNNEVIHWKLLKDRKGDSVINVLDEAIAKTGIAPKIIHTDHGVEYGNKYWDEYLSSKNIVQSKSPKGNSLANRPSEYFFGLIKRERLYLLKYLDLDYNDVVAQIDTYMNYYHLGRSQKSLAYKTPLAFKQMGLIQINKLCPEIIS